MLEPAGRLRRGHGTWLTCVTLAIGLFAGSAALGAQPIPNARFRAFDSNGLPLSGGKLYSFLAGTSTPYPTYTTRAATVANSNPVTLDANGEANVWLTSNTLYKLELRNSAGTLQWSVDNVPSPPDPGTSNTFPLGITVTQSQTNAPGVTATGNGTAPGVTATGGSTGIGGVFTGGASNAGGLVSTATGTGVGVLGKGAGVTGSGGVGVGGLFAGAGAAITGLGVNNSGVVALGGGSGTGVEARGGSTASGVGDGLRSYGGAGVASSTNGRPGVVGVGGAAFSGGNPGAGAEFTPGTPQATSSVRQDAVRISGGDITFSVDPPASSTGMTNRITAHNTPKAWAELGIAGGGSTSVTIRAGFNVASSAVAGPALTLDLADDMQSSDYAVLVTPGGPGFACSGQSSSAGQVLISCWDSSAGAIRDFQAGTPLSMSVLVFGAQ